MKSFRIAKSHQRRNLTLSLPLGSQGYIALVTILLALTVAGCQKSKEDIARDRIANRKPAGYVRFANFSGSEITPAQKGVKKPNVEDGTVTVFIIRPSGKEKTGVFAGDKSIFDDNVQADPGGGTTLAITSKGVKIYTQATRDAQAPNCSVHVFMVSDSGNVTVSADGQSLFDKVGPQSESDFKVIPAGHHKFTAKTADGKAVDAEADFDAGNAYSIFVAADKSNPKAVVVQDTPNKKPAAQGGMVGAG